MASQSFHKPRQHRTHCASQKGGGWQFAGALQECMAKLASVGSGAKKQWWFQGDPGRRGWLPRRAWRRERRVGQPLRRGVPPPPAPRSGRAAAGTARQQQGRRPLRVLQRGGTTSHVRRSCQRSCTPHRTHDNPQEREDMRFKADMIPRACHNVARRLL